MTDETTRESKQSAAPESWMNDPSDPRFGEELRARLVSDGMKPTEAERIVAELAANHQAPLDAPLQPVALAPTFGAKLLVAGLSLYKRARAAVSGSLELSVGSFSFIAAVEPLQLVVPKPATRGRIPVSTPKTRPMPVGFGPKVIQPGEKVKIETEPQMLFRGKRLIVTCDCTNLYITDLTVDGEPQLPVRGHAIAADTFRGDSPVELRLKVCAPTQKIVIEVENLGKEERTFSATIYGDIVL